MRSLSWIRYLERERWKLVKYGIKALGLSTTIESYSSIASKITLCIRNKGILVSLPVKNRHFLYNASIIWNLSLNKIGVPSIHKISPCVFKTKIKRFLVANQFSGNKENWTDNNIKYQLFTRDNHKTKTSN